VLKSYVPVPVSRALDACRPHLVAAAFFSALINILYLAPTIYMMQVYDRVVPTGGIITLVWITAVLALAIGTLTALEATRSRILMRVSLRLNRLLSGEILDRLMSRAKMKQGEPSSAQALREFDTIRQTIGGPAAAAVFDAPWTPLYLLVAFLIHPILGLLIIGAGIILITLALVNEKHTSSRSAKAHQATSAAYAAHSATVSEAEAIRALGMRRAMVSRQITQRAEGLEASNQVQVLGLRYNTLVKFIRMFMQSLALGAGAWLAVTGQISVGAIIAASVLLSRALQPIEQLVGSWPTIMQARNALGTVRRLYAATDSVDATRTTLPTPKGHLELERIVVKGPPSQGGGGADLILRNVSFAIQPGEVLGVIGPSGSGKSTLARIAAGAITPDAGEVRVDGANIADWDPEGLAAHVGYLPQNMSLLPGTIAENISRFATVTATDRAEVDREVIEAAKLSGAHEMILGLPNGYDTVIKANGFELSAGQGQRVALARALYGSPRVFILDEPNSALDQDGEKALDNAVRTMVSRGAAVMIVAHRTAVLNNADKLVVMNQGAVAQYGPRQDVVEELRKSAARAANVVPIAPGVQASRS
jgi:PrtD family type I secretion system ABC transporter